MKFDARYFGENILKNIEPIPYNFRKYCHEIEHNLPTTLTDNLRGFGLKIEPLSDYSGFRTYFYIKLGKNITYYHSLAEVYEIIWKTCNISKVAVKSEKLTPIKENGYTAYLYEIDMGYYRYPTR